mmetsp:Transcript_31400/g.45167  ORF Transcript_31400/g.45167 Transcript_31400/m.45167 type:complete len:101 (+) Transcript_31400:85-387(+)
MYTTPKGRRQAKSAKYTSPFPSFWYCSFPSYQSAILQHLHHIVKSSPEKYPYHIANKIDDIPVEVAPDSDPRKKKLRNAQKRSKHKKRQQEKRTHPGTEL